MASASQGQLGEQAAHHRRAGEVVSQQAPARKQDPPSRRRRRRLGAEAQVAAAAVGTEQAVGADLAAAVVADAAVGPEAVPVGVRSRRHCSSDHRGPASAGKQANSEAEAKTNKQSQ